MSNQVVILVGRILLSAMFIMSGVQKLGGIEGTAGYIASVGLPMATALAWAAAIFEVVAGLAVLVGFQTRIAAYLLAAFSVFTGFVFHSGADMMQQIMLMKNLTIAGGFLVLAAFGPGSLSADARLKK
jgi:putative oxidoreductase